MGTVRNGSVIFDGGELDVDGKIYRSGWQNTAYIPLVKTLNAINAKYEWNNEDKILTVTYDEMQSFRLKTRKTKSGHLLRAPVFTPRLSRLRFW